MKFLGKVLTIILAGIGLVKATTYEIKNNGAATVIISATNPTRLKVLEDRLANMHYNANELRVEADGTTGEVFLKPVLAERGDISVFLRTEENFSCRLQLRVREGPARQIFIRKLVNLQKNHPDGPLLELSDDYRGALVNLLRSAYHLESIPGFTLMSSPKKLSKITRIKGLEIRRLYSYTKNSGFPLVMEVIQLTNKSSLILRLMEENFFRPGLRAVKLDKFSLEPGESCRLYLLSDDKNL
jgi:type-F conjugative transfer system secretin TraK